MLPPPRNAGAQRPPLRAVCTNHRRLTGKVLHGAHFPMKFFCFCWESFPPFTGLATIQMSDSVFRLNYENTIELWFFASSPGVDAFSFLHRPDHRGSRFRRRSAFGPGTRETQQPSGPKSGHSYKNDVSPPLRDLPRWREGEGKPEHEANENPKIPHRHRDQADPVIQNKHAVDAAAPSAQVPTPLNTFDGIPFPGVGCNCAPPDTNGEVGSDAIRSNCQRRLPSLQQSHGQLGLRPE